MSETTYACGLSPREGDVVEALEGFAGHSKGSRHEVAKVTCIGTVHLAGGAVSWWPSMFKLLARYGPEEALPDKPSDSFTKHDSEKPRTELLPPTALVEVSKVLAHGAEKYEAHNWRQVDDRERYTGACLRHLLAHMSGEDVDPDSGLPHLAHLACNALFLVEASVLGLGKDTRPKGDK